MALKDDLISATHSGSRTDDVSAWIGSKQGASFDRVVGSPVKLTRRELEVLCLVAKGRSSQEVADNLCLAKRTIDFHLANIYGKLSVNNRVQAFRAAARLGLVPFEGVH